MKLFIPAITTKMVLTAPWTFTMFMEDRNNKLIGELLTFDWDLKRPAKDSDGYYKFVWEAKELGPCTFPIGTRLSVDRIYIRKGQKDFDSISFNVQIDSSWRGKPKVIKGRFWVKLEDANKIDMDLVLGK
jgi:hypothetical protein